MGITIEAIPKGATNGDVIKAMFTDVKVWQFNLKVWLKLNYLLVDDGTQHIRRMKMEVTETIKVEYNGYTGYAYGVSSFSIRDKNDKEIFHTGFLRERPTNEAECLQTLKELLDLLKKLREM